MKLLALFAQPVFAIVFSLLMLWACIIFGLNRVLDLFGVEPIDLSQRLWICAIVGLAFGIVWFYRRNRALARSLQMQETLAGSGSSSEDDLAAVGEQFKEALDALQSSRLGKRALYELPWYLMMGPSGSGKTTFIKSSGLTFPDPRFSNRRIRGSGGTRNCDWFFSNEAILIDTAGRYTGDHREDRDEWQGFLRMLRDARSRQPLNGAIVGVGLDDLMRQDEQQAMDEALRIRERLQEISEETGVAFPVYLTFTKCDLVAGFVETFEGLGRAEREQVWGFTVDRSSGETVTDVFEREFCELVSALETRRIRLLASDRPKLRMGRAYAFPLQFRSLQERLQNFVQEIVVPSRYGIVPDLRGVYFTSGTQEGSPIDRVLGRLQDAFGLSGAKGVDEGHEAERKAYFIYDLFQDVVLPERHLARRSDKVAAQVRNRRRRNLIGVAGGSVVMAGALVWRHGGQGAELREFQALMQPVAESPAQIFDGKEPLSSDAEKRLAVLLEQAGPEWVDPGELPMGKRSASIELLGRVAESPSWIARVKATLRARFDELSGDSRASRDEFRRALSGLRSATDPEAALDFLRNQLVIGEKDTLGIEGKQLNEWAKWFCSLLQSDRRNLIKDLIPEDLPKEPEVEIPGPSGQGTVISPPPKIDDVDIQLELAQQLNILQRERGPAADKAWSGTRALAQKAGEADRGSVLQTMEEVARQGLWKDLQRGDRTATSWYHDLATGCRLREASSPIRSWALRRVEVARARARVGAGLEPFGDDDGDRQVLNALAVRLGALGRDLGDLTTDSPAAAFVFSGQDATSLTDWAKRLADLREFALEPKSTDEVDLSGLDETVRAAWRDVLGLVRKARAESAIRVSVDAVDQRFVEAVVKPTADEWNRNLPFARKAAGGWMSAERFAELFASGGDEPGLLVGWIDAVAALEKEFVALRNELETEVPNLSKGFVENRRFVRLMRRWFDSEDGTPGIGFWVYAPFQNVPKGAQSPEWSVELQESRVSGKDVTLLRADDRRRVDLRPIRLELDTTDPGIEVMAGLLKGTQTTAGVSSRAIHVVPSGSWRALALLGHGRLEAAPSILAVREERGPLEGLKAQIGNFAEVYDGLSEEIAGPNRPKASDLVMAEWFVPFEEGDRKDALAVYKPEVRERCKELGFELQFLIGLPRLETQGEASFADVFDVLRRDTYTKFRPAEKVFQDG